MLTNQIKKKINTKEIFILKQQLETRFHLHSLNCTKCLIKPTYMQSVHICDLTLLIAYPLINVTSENTNNNINKAIGSENIQFYNTDIFPKCVSANYSNDLFFFE